MKLTLLICALALFTVANAANLRARTLDDPSIGQWAFKNKAVGNKGIGGDAATAAAPAKKCAFEGAKKGSADWCKLNAPMYGCKACSQETCGKGERADLCKWGSDGVCVPKDDAATAAAPAKKEQDAATAAPAKKDKETAPKKLTKNKEAKELVDDDEKVYGDVNDPQGNCTKLRAKDKEAQKERCAKEAGKHCLKTCAAFTAAAPAKKDKETAPKKLTKEQLTVGINDAPATAKAEVKVGKLTDAKLAPYGGKNKVKDEKKPAQKDEKKPAQKDEEKPAEKPASCEQNDAIQEAFKAANGNGRNFKRSDEKGKTLQDALAKFASSQAAFYRMCVPDCPPVDRKCKAENMKWGKFKEEDEYTKAAKLVEEINGCCTK